MRDMGIKSPSQVFTALYNACANSGDKRDGLKRALWLRDHMVKKQITPHYITYKAAIKAFAMMADIQTAFSLLDEALEDGCKLDTEAISMILMACITDRSAGFKHALQVRNSSKPLWQVFPRRKLFRKQFHFRIGFSSNSASI